MQENLPNKENLEFEKFSGIKELEKRIEKIETKLEKEKMPEKEKIIKKEIKTYLEKFQKMPVSSLPLVERDEVKEIKKFPAAQQVGALVSLVFEKNLKKAISLARALNDPAILDEFHDVLVDRYYKILIEKKIIKEK